MRTDDVRAGDNMPETVAPPTLTYHGWLYVRSARATAIRIDAADEHDAYQQMTQRYRAQHRAHRGDQ